MHSFIIHSGSEISRIKQIRSLIETQNSVELSKNREFETVTEPDLFVLKPITKSIGIDDVRKIIHFLAERPIKWNKKVVLIKNADLLTIPSQHALLKTLEEPSPHTIIILEIENPNTLLETLLSRCQLITVQDKTTEEGSTILEEEKHIGEIFSEQNHAKRMIILNELLQNHDPLEILKSLLFQARKEMKQNPKLVGDVKLIQECIRALKQNVNTKLILEHCAIHLNTTQSKDN